MHDHLNPSEGNVVEEVRLDHLQPLVDERRRVDGDDRAHRPRGVGERLRRGDVGQLRPAAAPEGPSGGRDDELAHVGARAGGERLEERRVLRVDRDDLPRPGERLHQRPAHDERLLVGEREGAARLEGGEGRGEADGPGDAVEHGVAGGAGQLGGRLRPGEQLGQRLPGPVPLGQGLAQRRYGVLAGDGDGAHPEAVGLLGEQCDPSAGGGQAGHPEPVGVAQHEVDGLGADRAGGAEDHDIPYSVDGVEDEMRIGEGAGLSLIPPLWPHRPPGRTPRPARARAVPRAAAPRGARCPAARGPVSAAACARSPCSRAPVWRPRSRGLLPRGRRRPPPATRTPRRAPA